MVDWGSRRRREMHVERMQAAAKHPSGLPPATTMLQEEESELNVMAFVETEYRSDAGEDQQGRPGAKRKKVHPRPQTSKRKGSGTNKAVEKMEAPKNGGKTAPKKKKRKHTHKTGEQSNTTNMVLYYPNAAFLKNLCDKVGRSQGSSESLPNRIFNQLRHTEVHYPYASLLQALHRHAKASAEDATSPSTGRLSEDQPSTSLEVARAMSSLRYPTTSHRGNRRENATTVTPFSTVLMAMVMKEKQNNFTSTQPTTHPTCSVGGIGEILKKEMPHSQKDDPAPSELSSASLLQKLSLSAQRDLQVSSTHKGSTWTSTESSQSEEDDRDCQPTCWLTKDISKDAVLVPKRKSSRKKSVICDQKEEQPNTSREGLGGVRRGLLKVKLRPPASETARSKLLQLIMSRQQETPEKRSKKARKRTKVTKKKGKRKQNDKDEDCETLWVATGLTEAYNTPIETADLPPNESQSLLKEYLLKPAGEEVVPSENCDIPKLETNFLFSRLLQNFKSLAESNQPEERSKKSVESSGSHSILRGMLASTITPEEPEHKFSPGDHHNTSSSSSEQQQRPTTPSEPSEAHTRVKLEDDIKVECEEEEIVCKVECEEDGFECQVCHLQFSSLTDLSNHQVLFHCSEEPQTPSPRRLLGCSVEGLGGGVMQGKQPA